MEVQFISKRHERLRKEDGRVGAVLMTRWWLVSPQDQSDAWKEEKVQTKLPSSFCVECSVVVANQPVSLAGQLAKNKGAIYLHV